MAIMTLAYFSSTDSVTNQLYSKTYADPSIELLEPLWDDKGKELAQHSVPDMTIPKDPYVKNTSNSDLYVRLKIEVLDGDGNPTDVNRTKAILDSIYYLDSDGKYQQLLTTTITKDNTLEVTSYDGNNFFYYDGYYYYGTTDGTTYSLTTLAARTSTPTLFDAVITPAEEKITVDDEEKYVYDEYFSTPFSIKVSAQSVCVPEKATDFKDIIKIFKTNFK
jgi:hypothetical protein